MLAYADRRRAFLLLAQTAVMAFLDVIGIAAIVPFMKVLTDPTIVDRHPALRWINAMFEFSSPAAFLFALGIAVFVLLLSSLSFRAFTTYRQLRFSLMQEFVLGRRMVEGYLNQPYEWFLNRHSSDIGKTILSEISSLINQGLMPLITAISQLFVVLLLLILLVFVDSELALMAGGVLGLSYAVIFAASARYLDRIGRERADANELRFKVVTDAFAAVKEVKIGGLEQAFLRQYEQPAVTFASHQASANTVSQLPRFAMEALAFGGMLLVNLWMMAREKNMAEAIPVMALFAYAGFRLIPALQQVYANLTQIHFIAPVVHSVSKDLAILEKPEDEGKRDPFLVRECIALKNVCYRYPGASSPSLNGFSLSIPVGAKIGLVGATGSGKTTTLDVLLGLLIPESGLLQVDDNVIDSTNRRRWQDSVGYVPQQIFLTDGTIAENIAFGVEPAKINITAVQHAAKIASMHDFIETKLPDGYSTKVGERGVRLSGGQRQRIGIARAMYHNPRVLVLDEATSALDNITEQSVMEAVRNLTGDITVIMVAHRLTTVQDCDHIHYIDGGKIIASGTFENLSAKSERFRAMAAKG